MKLIIFLGNSSSHGMRVTAALSDCTCCVIKPHAFKSKHTGKQLIKVK